MPHDVDHRLVEQRILEQAQRLPPGGAVTGWASLRLAGGGYFDGLDQRDLRPLPVPLSIPPEYRIRPSPAFVISRRRLEPTQVVIRHGMPCTSVERAICDEVRRLAELRAGVAVLDLSLAGGLTTATRFDEHLSTCSHDPGIRLVRAVRALTEVRTLSPQETAMRLIWLLDAGYPKPRCNWPVADADGRFIGRPDLLCTELGVYGEFDGAEHRNRGRHRDDVRRHEDFHRAGLEGFVLVGGDISDKSLAVGRMQAAVRRAEQSGVPRAWHIRVNPGPL